MKTTLNFLNKLDENNNREWFQDNKTSYDESHQEMLQLADQLIDEMNGKDHIETSSAKQSLYRIYRDVRFGKDKTPYKTNWAGRLKRATEELRGGYYYQVGIKGSFVMGGFFGPNSKDLMHIRKHISQNAEGLREIINSRQFIEAFGELRGRQLTTAPRGFDRSHPEIDLLRYKQFLVRHDFTNKEIMSKDFHIKVANAFQQMRPFFDHMSDILTTDLNGQSII